MNSQLLANNLSNIYSQDFNLWLEMTAQLLQERNLEALDCDNLLQEIIAMGNEQKHKIESNLIIILLHLLKWKYQPQKRSNSWLLSIREHRRRIQRLFRDSPSLKPYFHQVLDECYSEGRQDAAIETGLSLEAFPTQCPFSSDEILNFDFLPQ